MSEQGDHGRRAHGEREIHIQLDAERSAAQVSVRAGPAASAPELRRALDAAGVRAGIDDAAFAQLALALEDPSFEVDAAPIARAQPARAGEPGRLELFFAYGLQPGHARDDDTLDYHDRELLKPVAQGDRIGRACPAQPGVAGSLVDGTLLEPSPVPALALELGPGAQLDAEGVIVAARAGVVLCRTPSALDVVDQHVHEGEVDLRSGHLHMLGSLRVQGDVHNGFGVYASGDVEIRGGVDNGSVYAGGNVWVQQGVRGAAGAVCAEGDLEVRHAESATLSAGGTLRVGEALHARLAAVRVEVLGKLRGGVAAAELSARVHEAGSPQARSTEIAVAQPLELPVEAARQRLESAKVARSQRSSAGTAGRARGKGGKLGRAQAALQATEIRRLAQRARRRRELSAQAFVEVRFAHAGVSIRVADHELLLDADVRAVRFSLDPDTQRIITTRIPA